MGFVELAIGLAPWAKNLPLDILMEKKRENRFYDIDEMIAVLAIG